MHVSSFVIGTQIEFTNLHCEDNDIHAYQFKVESHVVILVIAFLAT